MGLTACFPSKLPEEEDGGTTHPVQRGDLEPWCSFAEMRVPMMMVCSRSPEEPGQRRGQRPLVRAASAGGQIMLTSAPSLLEPS